MSEVLRGVRVVELASWTYVPSAGAALADWGADVIKVEDVKGGDPGRALVIGGFTRQNARADVDFILEIGNRGKRSIAIDIKSDTGRAFLGRLLATADVFLTNWLPGALERARLTVEDVRSFNPTIIIARGTGTGVRGPDADKGPFLAVPPVLLVLLVTSALRLKRQWDEGAVVGLKSDIRAPRAGE